MTIANSPVEAFELQRVAAAQRQGFSLFCINAEGDTPGFVYTIGMAQHQLPELMMFFTDDGASTPGMVASVAQRLIAGLQRFDRITLLRAATSRPINAGDSQVTAEFLRGDDYSHALQAYLTRAARYRGELGAPRGVLVLNHEDVPSFQQVRCSRMLAVS